MSTFSNQKYASTGRTIIPVFLFGPERALPKRYFLPVPVWMNIIIAPPQAFTGSVLDTTQA
ncbi:MAG TPA: hypothetical protein QGI39_13405, partial [Gammaproteobacteria bacterium]|nr:hypothetical protein [Gammaproteobacteria bacterium]